MTGARPASILRQLDDAAATDRELLGRFAQGRDQAAFADLVARHGSLVLGVCVRVTGHRQDAEDAFQAVFLTLARKAGSIGNPDLLGNWLYGVAVRVAQTARRSAARRRRWEVQVEAMPDPTANPPTPLLDLGPALDEELAALSSWYRDAIVLCDLRGVPRPEAARLLGVPEGTLSSRLAAGRKKLAEKLARRGFALAVVAVPATLAQTARAVSPTLYANTCKLVGDYLAGIAVPRPLAKLSDGGMTVRQALLLGLLTTAAAVAGVVYARQPGSPEPPVAGPPKPVAQAKPDPAQVPLAKAEEKPSGFTTQPRMTAAVDVDIPYASPHFAAAWSDDGKKLAVAGAVPVDTKAAFAPKKQQGVLQSVTPLSVPVDIGESRLIGFDPKGRIVTELFEDHLLSAKHTLDFWVEGESVYWTEGKPPGPRRSLIKEQTTPLELGKIEGFAFSPDGKTFRTVAIDAGEANKPGKLEVLEVDAMTGKRLRTLLTVPISQFAFSLDGKRLALTETTLVTPVFEGGSQGKPIPKELRVVVYDVDRGTKMSTYTVTEDVAEMIKGDEQALSRPGTHLLEPTYPRLAFSPDGRRLLFCRGLGSRLMVRKPSNRPLGGDGLSSGPDKYDILLLSGGTGQMLVLDPEKGRPVTTFGKGNGFVPDLWPVGSAAFNSDGRLLALSGTRYEIDKKIGPAKGPPRDFLVLQDPTNRLEVWDTETGRLLKAWKVLEPYTVFSPTKPLLAVLERNGDGTRVGFWDFAAEAAEKK